MRDNIRKMGTRSKKSEEWQSCQPGFLVGVAERTKSARRRRLLLRASAGVVVVVCGVGLGLWSADHWSMQRENYFGGIACHEVKENMPALVAGTLPDELKARIEAHLRECPACREMMLKMQANQAVGMTAHDYWTCECPECRRQFAHAVALAVSSMEASTVRGDESRQQLALAREL